jgi:hypothetical protein
MACKRLGGTSCAIAVEATRTEGRKKKPAILLVKHLTFVWFILIFGGSS